MALAIVFLWACGDASSTTEPASTPAATGAEETEPVSDPPSSDSPEPAPTTAAGTTALVPGVSIGPIRLGMTRSEVDALGVLSPHPQYSAMTLPYSVQYEEDVVIRVEAAVRSLTGVRVGDVTIASDATMQSAAALLADCDSEDLRTGGNIQRCRGGAVLLKVGSGSPDELWIQIARQQ